jgi:hypothetical protein
MNVGARILCLIAATVSLCLVVTGGQLDDTSDVYDLA